MIAVDTNILVYAHRYECARNETAFRILESLIRGPEAWAIPWPCVHEFLAVVTSTRAFRPPTPLAAAIDQIEIWRDSGSLVLLEETLTHWSTLSEVLRTSGVIGGAVHDARIAALCLEHGVRELWTADRDFARFAGLATFNPLEDDQVHDGSPSYAAAKRARAAGRRRAAAH